jgi:hypothetical protein
MRRALTIVLLATIGFLPGTVEAQRRGGPAGGGPSRGGSPRSGPPRGGQRVSPPAGRPQAPVRGNPNFRGPAARPVPPVAPAHRLGFRRAPIVRPVPPVVVQRPRTIIRNSFVAGRPGFISPFGSPFGSPFVTPFGTSFVSSVPVYAEPAFTQQVYTPPVDITLQTPAVSETEVDLAYQVRRLTEEVQQLRQEQALRESPPFEPPPAIPAVLVFRDGRRLEVQGYVIVGQTLWIVDERSAAQIPLFDLDLDATRKANQERGIRFLR